MIGILDRIKNLVKGLPKEVPLGSECSLFGKHRGVAIRRGYPQYMCRCGAIGVGSIKVGKNTITLSPGGVDVIRWSGSQAPIAAGDLGMDLGTGAASLFISGASRSILTTFSLQQSVFNFTHLSGVVSTGALGFTPRFAIYTVRAADSGASPARDRYGVSVITGVGAGANWIGITTNGSTSQSSASGPGTAITIGTSGSLTVTTFDASGVALTWSGGATVTAHDGYLLVIG